VTRFAGRSAWNNKRLRKAVFFIKAIAGCFMPDSYLAYNSTVKVEVICSSETSVDFHQNTRRYVSA
jgi:hypothetical protein